MTLGKRSLLALSSKLSDSLQELDAWKLLRKQKQQEEVWLTSRVYGALLNRFYLKCLERLRVLAFEVSVSDCSIWASHVCGFAKNIVLVFWGASIGQTMFLYFVAVLDHYKKVSD